MKIDWTTQYVCLTKVIHDVMFQPILDFILAPGQVRQADIKEMSKMIKYEAFYTGKHSLGVYAEYYKLYAKMNPDKFNELVEKVKLLIMFEVMRITKLYQECYDKEQERLIK